MKKTALRRALIPAAAAAAVLAALLLPPWLSHVRDTSLIGRVHTEVLTQDTSPVRCPTTEETLELLGRAVRDPDLEISTSVESLSESDQTQPLETLRTALEQLAGWGVLPEGVLEEEIRLDSPSRAVYRRTDTGISAALLYLPGQGFDGVNFWMVVDEDSGLPLWVDCTLPDWTPTDPAQAGTRFFAGLDVEAQLLESSSQAALFEITGTHGLLYGVSADAETGRLSIGPMGFLEQLTDETASQSK